jgi:hypothetical protein
LVFGLRNGPLFDFCHRNPGCPPGFKKGPRKKPIRKTKLESEKFMKIRTFPVMATPLAGGGLSRAMVYAPGKVH